MRSQLFVFALVPVVLALIPVGIQEETPFDKRDYPKEMQPLAVLTSKRCSKCHSLKRVLNAKYEAEEWDDSVFLMAEKPKSNITEQEVEKISSFLQAWGASKPRKPRATDGPVLSASGTPIPKRESASWKGAVTSSYSFPASAAFPIQTTLEGFPFEITGVDTGGESAQVSVRMGTQAERRSLTTSAQSSKPIVLKTWALGRHTFTLRLVLYEVRASQLPSSGAEYVLATLVSRSVR